MKTIAVAPSVLSLDYSQFEKQCQALNDSEAEYLHFDVMDGHFVPNLTFGSDILKGFKKVCPQLIMDVHLMIEDPYSFIESFAKAGADLITFHYEAVDPAKISELIDYIHSFHIKAGISIKPKTDVSVLEQWLDQLDLVLIMSVEPGFGGQKFMCDMLDKVRFLRKQIDENDYHCLIEIDGGINHETSELAKNAGVDILVAGSYVFKGNIQENIRSLK